MYVTIYVRKVKRRKTGSVEIRGEAYQTKSLTGHHEFIRGKFPDSQTWKDPKRVITDFTPGWNLGMLPLVSGGERIA